jgi:lysophospholipase L1-like esterase
VHPLRSLGGVLTIAFVLGIAWTCTSSTHTRADDPVPTAGGEEPLVLPFDPIDEGVPGLRMAIDDPSGRAMRSLHAALRRATRGEGKARLLFWGASHVASDSFTGRIRTELQSRFGDGGHGFVMPVHPWRTYQHFGVELESNGQTHWTTHRIMAGSTGGGIFGFGGVAVESSLAGAYGTLQTVADGPWTTTASSFELYYLKQPGGGSFDVLIDGVVVEHVATHGETHEPAYARYEVPDGTHSFGVHVTGNGPARIFGVVVERDSPGVVVDALGINGARARYQLLWDDAVFRAQLAHRDPDLVVLAYGTNEAGDEDVPVDVHASRLREVIARVRETVPRASCLLVGPTDRPVVDRRNRNPQDRPFTLEINRIQREIAFENGCGFFDLVAFMGGPMSMVRWVHDGYGAPDHVHFTRQGYQRLGEVLFGAIVHGYGELPQPPMPADEGLGTTASVPDIHAQPSVAEENTPPVAPPETL